MTERDTYTVIAEGLDSDARAELRAALERLAADATDSTDGEVTITHD